MREIELIYVEVMNETEHIFIFTTKFNGEDYAQLITLNMALPIVMQDAELNRGIATLVNINRKTAKTAIGKREI